MSGWWRWWHDDAFEMLYNHDNLLGARFSSSVLSDCASVYLQWRCKVPVVTKQNEMTGGETGDEAFDWSIAVHSVVYDTHKSQSASLRWHTVETPRILCMHVFLSQILVNCYSSDDTVVKNGLSNSQEALWQRRGHAIWLNILLQPFHDNTVTLGGKKKTWLFVVTSKRWRTIL